LYDQAGISIEGLCDDILGSIIQARTLLFENNVSESCEVVAEVTPAVAEKLINQGIKKFTSNNEIIESGCIGSIAGCKIFVSNNVHKRDAAGAFYHDCIVRTKRAIAFAEQLSEINAYRPEKRFADAVKGLHLYGAKVVYPTEMVLLELETSLN
jgi:hypothetical protein